MLVSFAKFSNSTPLLNHYSSISYETFCLILFLHPKFIYQYEKLTLLFKRVFHINRSIPQLLMRAYYTWHSYYSFLLKSDKSDSRYKKMRPKLGRIYFASSFQTAFSGRLKVRLPLVTNCCGSTEVTT